MKKSALILFTILINFAYAQKAKQNNDVEEIKKTINSFLDWHKTNNATIQESDVVNGPNSIFVVRIVDSLAYPAVDTMAVAKHIAIFKSSQCVSEAFLDTLKKHYKELEIVNKDLEPSPVKKLRTDMFAVNLDRLFGDDLEEILKNYQAGKYYDISVASTKAIAKFLIEDYSNEIQFTLSKIRNKWLIDNIKYIE